MPTRYIVHLSLAILLLAVNWLFIAQLGGAWLFLSFTLSFIAGWWLGSNLRKAYDQGRKDELARQEGRV